MKRFKNIVIGGIESKVFNLILVTILLLAGAYTAISLFNSRTLSTMVSESGEKQQTAISETTSAVMDEVVSISLERANRMNARVADEMFSVARDRVVFLTNYAEKLFADAQEYAPRPYALPDLRDDGKWTAKVIYAEGVDREDPAIVSKLGLLANMSEVMISLCPSVEAANVYIGMPEGVHFTVSDTASSWYVDGELREYDPRTRGWYQKAVAAGGVIFTDGEWDANTGAYCIECAAPVYGADGSLQAVVGTDLYLKEMHEVMEESSVDGEYYLILNQSGHAVLTSQKGFPGVESEEANDIRQSASSTLSQVAADALAGQATGIVTGELGGGAYYLTASPIETTGWVLVSAYDQAVAGEPSRLLGAQLEDIQTQSRAAYADKMKQSRTLSMLLMFALMALTLGAAVLVGKRIVRPLNAMTHRIANLKEDDLVFEMEDTFRTGDEVEALAESFSALSKKTRQYMDEVISVTAEKERIGAELALANNIQSAMLPHIFPAFPTRSDFDIYAVMDPAKEVGGDFYDYFLIDDDHLCMVIADVSGKGVPAALFMMASKIILQSVAMIGHSPAEILAMTNEILCSNNEAEMFVTVWLGILELSTGKLTAANAGHEYPTIKQPDGDFVLYKDKHGFVLGAMEGAKYQEYELTLAPGSKLLVYTDGVPEATNVQEELFGTGRMIEALSEHPDGAPTEIIKNVRAAVDRFVQDAEQFDDLTLLCLEYKGQQ